MLQLTPRWSRRRPIENAPRIFSMRYFPPKYVYYKRTTYNMCIGPPITNRRDGSKVLRKQYHITENDEFQISLCKHVFAIFFPYQEQRV